MLYGLDDIVIIPEAFIQLDGKGECNPLDEEGNIPVFLTPDECSKMEYIDYTRCGEKKIASIRIDRDERVKTGDKFVEMSFLEASKLLKIEDPETSKHKIMLSGVTGHNLEVYDFICEAKEKFGDSWKIMVGGIENIDTFGKYVEAEADYISIGGNYFHGSSNYTGVGYPIASLIVECRSILDDYNCEWSEKSATHIVADYDFKNFSQMNKALALGADYLMITDSSLLFEQHPGDDDYMSFKKALVDMMHRTGSKSLNNLKGCQWDTISGEKGTLW